MAEPEEPSELEKSKRLVAAHKARIAAALGNRDDVSPSELAQVMKLENQIENREHFERLRRLTRHAPDGEPGAAAADDAAKPARGSARKGAAAKKTPRSG